MSDLPENPAPRTSVLIAEDKPVFRQLLAAAISRMGVDTETVSNGDKAYERAQRGGVDFLSLYYEMPFARKLKFWSEERGARSEWQPASKTNTNCPRPLHALPKVSKLTVRLDQNASA